MSAASIRTISIQEAVHGKNLAVAHENRERFGRCGILAANLLSSPGAGKTALLEATLRDTHISMPSAVIVGDLQTDNDAQRLGRWGATAIQVTTGDICHLDAGMVQRAVAELDLASLSVVYLENVGNLVCPTSFDLGESLRVALVSVTEGEDKPLKYPGAFKWADLILVTKIDLAAAVGFDRDTAITNLKRVSPAAQILEVSSRSGAGMEQWYETLRGRLPARERKP